MIFRSSRSNAARCTYSSRAEARYTGHMIFGFFEEPKSPEEAHAENVNHLQDKYSDKHAPEHIAETYEQIRNALPEFSHEELRDQADKRLRTELTKTIE